MKPGAQSASYDDEVAVLSASSIITLDDQNLPILAALDDEPAQPDAPPQKPAEPFEQQIVKVIDDLHQVISARDAALEDAERAHRHALSRLILVAAAKDGGTPEHCIRVATFSALVARELDCPDAWCNMIFEAAPLHDIGKVGTPDYILEKPSRLDHDEWQLMQTHTLLGARILGGSGYAPQDLAASIALNHHERWDGSGYPARRKGHNIPLAARIVAAADFLDSATSKLSYSEALSVADATALLKLSSGTHFDPEVVCAMQRIIPKHASIHEFANRFVNLRLSTSSWRRL